MEKVYRFIIINLLLIIFFIYSAFKVKNMRLIQKNKEPLTFIHFLNVKHKLTFKNVFAGLVFGIVFGFLDNFGLWMGISVLEKHMPGGVKTKSALGNTYSDFIGATIGTAMSILALEIFEIDNDDAPIWVNTIGILLGCLLGMFMGKLITGKS
jgi:hypothetical protein